MADPTVLIVGSGRMARIRAEAALAWNPSVRLVFCTREHDRAEELASRFGGVSARYEELPTTRCDAVIITSATAHHQADLTGAFGIGSPVLIEKPLGDTAEASRALAAVAESSGAPVVVGFQRRFDREFRAIHDAVRDGSLGRLYAMRSAAMDHFPGSAEFIRSSAGIFRDLFVHDFDTAMWIAGESFTSVYATGVCRVSDAYAEHGDLDAATVVGTLEGGAQVTMQGLRHCPTGQDVRLEAFGSLEVLGAGVTRRMPVRSIADPTVTCQDPYSSFDDRFADAFTAETASFLDSCIKHRPFLGCSMADAVRASVVAEACEQSVRLQAPVRIGQA